MSTVRDQLRGKILGQKPSSVIVTLDDGLEVEVRETSVGQMLDAVSEPTVKMRMIKILIESCYVPGTNDKVFEAGDAEVLENMPANGYYQKLMDAVSAKQLPAEIASAKK